MAYVWYSCLFLFFFYVVGNSALHFKQLFWFFFRKINMKVKLTAEFVFF